MHTKMRMRDRLYAKGAVTVIGLGLGVGLSQHSVAQQVRAQDEGLEEVVVTAERRTEDVQKTAAAVTARSGDDMLDQGKYSLQSILEDIPGMAGGAASQIPGVANSGTDSPASGLVIRGIASNVASNPVSIAAASAIYVDGVYSGVGGGYDIDRVEALRGPQGTLYGRSATSGLVSIHTRDPKLGEFTGDVNAEFGNYDLRHYSGGINLPLGDVWALRLSANKYSRDGFYAQYGGAGTYGQSGENDDGRAKLLFKPNDVLSVLLGVAGEDNTTYNGGTNVYQNSPTAKGYVFVPTTVGPGTNQTRQYWAQVDWDVGFAQLQYLPAYRNFSSTTILPVIIPPPVGSFTGYEVTPRDYFWTHELHLSSKPGSTLTWQVGALYYKNSLANDTYYSRVPSGGLVNDAAIRRDTTDLGAFAEATYPFAEDWRVTGGVRYDSTQVQVNEVYENNTNCNAVPPLFGADPSYCLPEILQVGTLSGDAGKRTFDKVTYKIRLEHDLTPTNMVYAMVSTANSPGDINLVVNTAVSLQPVPEQIQSETLTSYEVGSKNRFLDNKLQINGDVYYYDYAGFQQANLDLDLIKNTAGYYITGFSSINFAVVNTPVTSYGVELETLYQLTPDDRAGLNYAYTDAYYGNPNESVLGTGATVGDLFGFSHVVGVAPHAVTASYDHAFHLFAGSRLTVGGDERFLSSRNVGQVMKAQLNDPAFATAIYPYVHEGNDWVTDLNANWTSTKGMFTVTAWMRNVFNNQYKTNASVILPTLLTVPVPAYPPYAATSQTIGVTPYDPRTYGVSFGVRW
jgi:iron complex outermembrane receptor protein